MSYHTSGSMRSYGGGYGTISIGLANPSKLERGVTYSYTVNGTRYTAVADIIPEKDAIGLIDSNYTLPDSPPPFQENSAITILDATGLPVTTTKITSLMNYDSNGNGGKGGDEASMMDMTVMNTTEQETMTTTTSYQGQQTGQQQTQQTGQQTQQGENQEGNQQQEQQEQQEQEEMETQSSSSPVNPIVRIGLESPITNPALFIYKETGEPYFGLYHEHQDGTLMVGEGVLGVEHEINLSEIIIPNNVTLDGDVIITPTSQPQMSISQIREMFADTVYKQWFGGEFNDEAGSYTFKDMRLPEEERESTTQIDVKSIQSTIRGGKIVTGRQDGEQLVFYKKDSNTPESKKDYQDSRINEILADISSSIAASPNNEFDLESKLSFESRIDRGNDGNGIPVDVALTNQYGLDFLFDGDATIVGTPDGENPYRIKSFKYELLYTNFNPAKKIDIGELIFVNKDGEPEDEWYWYGWANVLNLSQVTTPVNTSKVSVDKARTILDTNIFELLPRQTTRQDEINDFINKFNNLIGEKPAFADVDNDGAGESITNYVEDERNRISYNETPNANITRLDSQANNLNQGKTLESMRNKLNTYLGDVDNVVESIDDERPEYENKANGFLKIRKPNQAIILRAPDLDELEFQKEVTKDGVTGPSFLVEGFTITMWIRFVGKTGGGTLFNFGNPLSSESPYGFTLETVCKQRPPQNNPNNYYHRIIKLGVRDHLNNTFHDNSWGTSFQPRYDTSGRANYGNGTRTTPQWGYDGLYTDATYPSVSTNDLNEWFFICATFNPSIQEDASLSNYYDAYRENLNGTGNNSKLFWQNHWDPVNNVAVANSNFGAKCKVEIISRTNLLLARGYKIGDLSYDPNVSSPPPPPTPPDLPPDETQEQTEEQEQENTMVM